MAREGDTLKRLARAVTPPALYAAASRLKRGRPDSPYPYEYVPEGWRGARPGDGWNEASVRDSYLAGWPAFVESVRGTGPQHLGAGYGLLAGHNAVACVSYALALAAWGRPSLSLLDWGGGLGQFYLRGRAALPGVRIEYHCKDVPLLAAQGRALFPEAEHPDVGFSSDESCLTRRYDFVLAATSLHYSEDWRRVLAALARAARGYLMLTRLPCHPDGPAYVYRHRALGSEFLSWSFPAGELLGCAGDAGLTLVREFLLDEAPQPIRGAPSPSTLRAYLFRGRDDHADTDPVADPDS